MALKLLDVLTNEEYALPVNKEVRIGRSLGNDIIIPSLKYKLSHAGDDNTYQSLGHISRFHATVTALEGDEALVKDTSKNGIYISDSEEKVSREGTKIKTGRMIVFGDTSRRIFHYYLFKLVKE